MQKLLNLDNTWYSGVFEVADYKFDDTKNSDIVNGGSNMADENAKSVDLNETGYLNFVEIREYESKLEILLRITMLQRVNSFRVLKCEVYLERQH